jgi:hypothetical protein
VKAKFASTLLVLVSTHTLAGDPTSAGDIVGRNLAIQQQWAAGVGHVGMYTGSSILEVLNAPTVIQLNSLSSFKTASTNYWGAKYGKGWNFATMVSTGMAQRSYGATYTTLPTASPGYIQYTCIQYNQYGQCVQYIQTGVVKGKFRCDTFVNYIYKSATGQDILTITASLTPNQMFWSYPYWR